MSAAEAGPERPPATPHAALDQAPHSTDAAETPAQTDGRMRSPSEERAEADIASLEAQLKELELAKKYGECAAFKELIDQKRKAQRELLELKAQLREAAAAKSYIRCDEIQKKIDELKVW